MNRLQFATLLSWADDAKVTGRKRLQKVVYFLQEAGCPLDCQFILHHFGPYSRDVADACDEMVAAGLVEEDVQTPAGGMQQYAYTLTAATQELLATSPDNRMERFQTLGTRLIGETMWPLELGSTIAFYYRQSEDWDDALAEACRFKKVRAEVAASQEALALAKDVLEPAGN